jgi:signal transduction histidine kinase/ActR/RegA family two-component response regulator
MPVSLDFEPLFRACPHPFALMDKELTIVDANDAYLREMGARAEEIIGRHLLMDEAKAGNSPAEMELERVNAALAERVRQLAEAERRQAFQLEVSDRLRRIDDPSTVYNEVCQLLRRHLGVARVLCGEYDQARKVVSYYGSFTEGRLPGLNDADPSLSFGAHNLDAVAAGQTWFSENLEDDPRTGGPDTWPTFKALGMYSGMVVPLNRRGPAVPCLFISHSAPRRWSKDEIRLAEDISERMWNAVERVRVEQALRLADLRKDEFLAMLAHELRNPLAPISAAAELLRVGSLDSESIRKTSQVIARQVGHMTGLVNDLLDVSRVTRGLVVLERGPVDMRRVVAEAVEQLGPLIEARRHRLSVQLAPEIVSVEGDHKRLVQVLANLLANAAKYTPEGGKIGLRLEVEGDTVILCVTDDGIGISPEMLSHVFDLFAQAHRTPDRSQGGLGLGLALVKSLVELHGGSVSAASEGQNLGCAFTVRLPCLHVAAQPARTADRLPDLLPFSCSLRVMVVDDNADAAGMLQLLLEGSGHDVVVEYDPLAALARASTERFDAFLLDIGLPRMEGRELARRLRQCSGNGDAMLVAVTGYGRQSDKVSALESGFDHYFVKPVDAEKLLEVLEGGHAQTQSRAQAQTQTQTVFA